MGLLETLTVEQRIALVAGLGGALLGGVLSALGGFLSQASANRNAKRRDAARTRQRQAVLAISGFQKLVADCVALMVLEKLVDAQFRNFNKTQSPKENPAEILGLIGGAQHNVERLTGEESEFLFKCGESNFVFQIWELQSSAANVEAIVSEYRIRTDRYHEFLVSSGTEIVTMSTTTIEHQLEGDVARRAEIMIGSLNSLVGNLIEFLDTETPKMKRAVSKYHEIAKRELGDDFSATAPVWKE